MRHRNKIRKLGVTASHRRMLMGNLALSLLEVGYVRTTHARAKALQAFIERLMTMAKRGDLHARRQALSLLPQGTRPKTAAAARDWKPPNKRAISRLFDELAPQYTTRARADGSEIAWNGGYVRVVKLGQRKGDAAEMSLISWVEPDSVLEVKSQTGSQAAKVPSPAATSVAEVDDTVEETAEEAVEVAEADEKPAEAKE